MSGDSIEILSGLVNSFADKSRMNIAKIEAGFIIDVLIAGAESDFSSGETDDSVESVQRSQFIYVTANRKTPEGDDMVQVFTICAPEDERYYKSALLLNMTLPLGAVALSDVDGVLHFVIVDTYLLDKLDAVQLEKSVFTLAEAGDRMENILTGADVV